MANSKSEIDPKKEFCSNQSCRDCGKRGTGNIVKYGHKKAPFGYKSVVALAKG